MFIIIVILTITLISKFKSLLENIYIYISYKYINYDKYVSIMQYMMILSETRTCLLLANEHYSSMNVSWK